MNAYYIFIHPYFPILPPPSSAVEQDAPLLQQSKDFVPSSPISLALYAILTLIPHPNDHMPDSQDSVILRRNQAHVYATMAIGSVEVEAELLASASSPAYALSSDPQTLGRAPFHPSVPVELESVLAFSVLSIYEYGQRGNLAKMRNRASQGYDAAIRLSLHEDCDSEVPAAHVEARRRAWWMTVRKI